MTLHVKLPPVHGLVSTMGDPSPAVRSAPMNGYLDNKKHSAMYLLSVTLGYVCVCIFVCYFFFFFLSNKHFSSSSSGTDISL